jgi:putative ATP-binding cassette transporter
LPPTRRWAAWSRLSSMHKLAIAAAAATLVVIVTGLSMWATDLLALGVVGVLLTFAVYKSVEIATFLRILAAVFGTEYILFSACRVLVALGLWPEALKSYELPYSLAFAVGVFGVCMYLIFLIPVIRTITRFANPYFESADPVTFKLWGLPAIQTTERAIGRFLLVFLVVLNQAQVGISVRLNFFYRDWFDAIQRKDAAAFWTLLLTVWLFWAIVFVISNLIEIVAQYSFWLRWRRWLTNMFTGRWLDRGTQYRMAIAGQNADNPDQRIAEDIKKYVESSYTYSISLISQASRLVSFSIILWGISAGFTIPGTEIPFPGMLFWIALVYAFVSTFITHWIGKPLIRLNFQQEQYEANFRFGLARLREYSEQVALLRGEQAERNAVLDRFTAVMVNTMRIIYRRVKLAIFTSTYDYSSAIIPYVISAPFFFAGKITLGVMQQTASAFGSVQTALSFFIDRYTSLADYKAVLDRLTTFAASIEASKPRDESETELHILDRPGESVTIEGLDLTLPGGRHLVNVDSLKLRAGESILLTGPSGSGKSTLFRALSGVWPYGSGRVVVPTGASVMLLPQRPYLPIGTLRAAVTYPSPPEAFDLATIESALRAVKLEAFVDRLGEEDVWSQRLSGGEQQRLQLARALLAKPDWLFLDEATASLDEPLEAEMYKVIAERLPDTTVVSIGHRSTLVAMHDRQIVMSPNADGSFTPKDRMPAAVPGE